jgi:two-component system OmpR family response regulator
MILSARTLSEDRTRGFEVGADQYLTKPFDLDELLSRVRTLLALYDRRAYGRIARAQNGSVYRFGDTSINFGTHEVSVRGQSVSLTQLELKLLQYFVQNPGRVISRDELLEQVWEMPASITTRAVDQFIRRLRKLFEPNPSEPIFFLTLRDAGYRFVADAKPETRS